MLFSRNIEDAYIEISEIEKLFGNEVKEIVFNLTEEKRDRYGPVKWGKENQDCYNY